MTVSGITAPVPLRAEEVVRRFYGFLSRGQMIEALNLFATDAKLRDESGHESSGIRAIAASLLPFRKPRGISIERLDPDGPDIRAVVRSGKGRSVGRFSVARGHIRSLQMDRL